MSFTPAALLSALVVLGCLVAMAARITHPVWADPTGLALGAPSGEAAAHLWGLWVAADGLTSHGPYVRVADAAWPAGFRGDLVDPLHLLIVAPAAWLGGAPGVVLAWNALPVVTLAVGAAGGAWLGARLGLGPVGQGLLAGLVVCSPAFAGATVPVGRSEQLVLGWASLHLAALHAAVRDGGGRRIAVAGVTLGALAMGGWRPLMLLLWLEVPLALAWSGGRRGLARALAVGGIGAALAAPMLAAHVGAAPWWWGAGPWPSPFHHEVEPARLGALLTLDGGGGWSGDPTANAGRVALVLAAVGALRRPRVVLPWLGLGAGLWVLALGLRISTGTGGAGAWFGPAAHLSAWVPPLRALHGWPRLAPLALLPLAVGAASGLDGRGRGAALVGLLGLGVALVEGLAWAPVGQGSVAAQPPPALAALPEGAIVSLPLAPAPGPAAQGAMDRALLHAAALGRPTTVAPSPYPVAAATLLGPLARVGRPGPPLPCAPDLAPRLSAAGVGGVVLHLDALPAGAAGGARAALVAQLGPPVSAGESWQAWAVPAETPCSP